MKKQPIRKCIGCYARKLKKELIKIIKPPKKENSCEIFVISNQIEYKNGRGAYVCKNENCIKAAKKKRALEKVFKKNVKEEIYEILKKETLNV